MMQSIIDIGSNTIRLAIYRIEAGRVELLLKKKQTVGLAAYIKDGVMQPEGIARAAAALQDFTAFLQEIGLPLTAAFATAALRNAVNREEALAAIKARTGLAIRVLSGTEEAELGFIGATHDLAAPAVLMADIGGGSTELVRCDNRAVVAKLSLPIGSLQLAARHVRGLFPTPKESTRIAKDAENALAALDAPLSAAAEEPAGSPFSGPFPTLCGIGGTFKGARNLYRALNHSPGTPSPFPAAALDKMITRFSSEKALTEDDLALFLKTEPDRLHTLIPGLILARALTKRLGVNAILYSDAGVREGFIYRELLKTTR